MCSSMRIALFGHRLAEPEPTGVGWYLRELVDALHRAAAEGDELVVASTPEPDAPDWLPAGVRSRAVPWSRTPVQLAWCLGVGPLVERGLPAPDVVHLTQPFPPVRSRAPQVVTIHDVFPFEHPDWYPRSQRWTYRRSATLALARAARIIVPSRFVADRTTAVLGVEPARMQVIPHGLSTTFRTDVSSSEVQAACDRYGVKPSSYVVTVGVVSARKNVLPLVEAIGELRNRTAPLVIVGPDGEGAEVVNEAIARHGAGRVIRTGYLSRAQVAPLIAGAAALAHPALAEGFGFVPLEAMAAGTAAVVSRSGAVPEVVGDAAVLVDEPTRPSAWATALDSVLDHPERRTDLAVMGRARAQQFSWQRTAGAVREVYAAVARA